jgi:hypothetical protein
MRHPPHWNSFLGSSNVFLIAGVVLLSLGVVCTCTGQVSARFSWVYRTEEPRVFWWLVAVYYLAGAVFVGIFLFN